MSGIPIFVAAYEEPDVGNPDRLDGLGSEQCAVEQRCVTGQQIAVGRVPGAELFDVTSPRQAPAQREGQAVRIVQIADHGRYLSQAVPVRTGQQGGQHVGVPWAAVVVGQPHPVRAECQCVQHSERETACATEVSA